MSAICVYTSSRTLPEIRDRLADCMVTHPRSSEALTSVPGCPLAADSGDRSSAASTPKHDSQADSCPGYLAARSLCQ